MGPDSLLSNKFASALVLRMIIGVVHTLFAPTVMPTLKLCSCALVVDGATLKSPLHLVLQQPFSLLRRPPIRRSSDFILHGCWAPNVYARVNFCAYPVPNYLIWAWKILNLLVATTIRQCHLRVLRGEGKGVGGLLIDAKLSFEEACRALLVLWVII